MFSPRRVMACLVIFVCAFPLMSCSKDEINKLREKAKQANDLLQAISDESNKLRSKISDLSRFEQQQPRPNEAIGALKREIDSEQTLLNKQRDDLDKLWDEIIKEASALSTGDLKDALEWLRDNLPLFYEYYNRTKNRITEKGDKLLGAREKVDMLQAVVGKEVSALEQLLAARSEAERRELRLHLADLQVQHTAVSLHEEIEAAQQLAAEFGALGPFPVVAGALFPREPLLIQEGLPDSLGFLDDGVLAAGAIILLQLPEGWRIEAPAEIRSETLELSVSGNFPGSSRIQIKVERERIAHKPDDSISVILRNVRIGRRPGLSSGVLMVHPGRIMTHDFLVLTR